MLQAFNGAIISSLARSRPRTGRRPHCDKLTANTLVGCAVFNYQNDKLGVTKEVLMDLENDNIACVLLSYGGFLGVGTHILPVASPEFAFHITEKYLLLDIELTEIRTREPALKRLVTGPMFK